MRMATPALQVGHRTSFDRIMACPQGHSTASLRTDGTGIFRGGCLRASYPGRKTQLQFELCATNDEANAGLDALKIELFPNFRPEA
jgi:hypothetical protein